MRRYPASRCSVPTSEEGSPSTYPPSPWRPSSPLSVKVTSTGPGSGRSVAASRVRRVSRTRSAVG
ncbi:hypothetical protein HFP72_03650 [Nocardiopsis sp. ARC36]